MRGRNKPAIHPLQPCRQQMHLRTNCERKGSREGDKENSMQEISTSPADRAAEQSLEEVLVCLDQGRSFLVEAGAGAGKTHSLVKALEHLIDKRGRELTRRNQQVACITYTNVAPEEIRKRIGAHPVVHASTIHALCWS